jgi:hypothetical protein
MLLREMFSPLGGPKDEKESEIDWAGDLKLYIDDHESLLTKYILPAIEKHKKYVGHPSVYKIYIKPLQKCVDQYCGEFGLDDKGKIFSPEQIIDLAKQYADQQNKFIERGDYQ